MPKFRGKHYYLGAWNYVLLDILYMIPGVGLIFLLVHSFSEKNENRRHYARSYFVRLLMAIVILGVAVGLYYLIAGSDAFSDLLKKITDQYKNLFGTGKTIDNSML
jgi:uncharacterized membrane protein